MKVINKSPYRCCDNHLSTYDVGYVCDFFWHDAGPIDESGETTSEWYHTYACTRNPEWIRLKPYNIKHTERFGCACHSKFIGVVVG
jgi:hypothetical protein